MIFKKLKRVWSHNEMNYIPKFRETFPELNKVSREELCNRWIALGIEFYTEEEKEINSWIRITLPLALIVWVLMFVSLPFKYMATGVWGYNIGNKGFVYNWFAALQMI